MKTNTHKTIIKLASILIPACIMGNPAINNSWTLDGMSYDSTTSIITFIYTILMFVLFAFGGISIIGLIENNIDSNNEDKEQTNPPIKKLL